MKISTTNVRKADGTKLVNGYKIALQKSEVERIGMGEETELFPQYIDGKIILTEADRLFPILADGTTITCIAYHKIATNEYSKARYDFKIPPMGGGEWITLMRTLKEIANKNEALPKAKVTFTKDGVTMEIDGKTYKGKKIKEEWI